MATFASNARRFKRELGLSSRLIDTVPSEAEVNEICKACGHVWRDCFWRPTVILLNVASFASCSRTSPPTEFRYALTGRSLEPSNAATRSSLTLLIPDPRRGRCSTTMASNYMPFDFNVDGHVDLQDQVILESCLKGPMVLPGCRNADVDEDSDIDLADYSELLNTFGLGG